MTQLPAKVSASQLAAETAVFAEFLQNFGLPIDNIIATTEERRVVADNLPDFLASLSPEQKADARYLSKFVGATAIGLFDAALNYIWNEVVLNLRKKAEFYGLDLFFDAAVGGSNRSAYSTAEDLSGLKDVVLLNTCLKLELISDIVYRKLDHILTMRNQVAASHPNVASIGGYELLGWLQTCVRDVLQEEPSQSAIQIRQLIDSIRSTTDVMQADQVTRISEEMKHLSTPHASNLLITLFGMYSTPGLDQVHRKNISLIAPAAWTCAPERVRFRVGITLDRYRTNLQQDRLQAGTEFLNIVQGQRYETIPAKSAALHALAERLENAHNNMNNFYTEPPIMEEIAPYCQQSGDIPADVTYRLVGAVIRCRVGRGVSYREGVSPAARPLYDRFLGALDDNGIAAALVAIVSSDVASKLMSGICRNHLLAILATLKPITIADRLRQCLEYIEANIAHSPALASHPAFRDLSSPYINWGP